MNRTSAVIDKSLFQAICGEAEPLRGELWGALFHRYQIVIPFALVEEVWGNLGKPVPKNRSVIPEMVTALTSMTSCWLDDEIEIVFKELVQRRKTKTLPGTPPQLIDMVLNLDPTDPQFSQWLDGTRRSREEAIRNRVKDQRAILPPGRFVIIKGEEELFERHVRGKFMQILESPDRREMLLEKLFGRQFRQRHPNFKSRMKKAFSQYGTATFTQFPITLSYIMAEMFYFYAPLCRVQPDPGAPLRKIIGSKRAEQMNNLQDQKYVTASLICDRLLTCDEGMRNLMTTFKRARLWKGEAVYIDPNVRLCSQIPRVLC